MLVDGFACKNNTFERLRNRLLNNGREKLRWELEKAHFGNRWHPRRAGDKSLLLKRTANPLDDPSVLPLCAPGQSAIPVRYF